MDIIGGLIGILVVGGILLYFKMTLTDYEIKSKPRSTHKSFDSLEWADKNGYGDPEYQRKQLEYLDKKYYNKFLGR